MASDQTGGNPPSTEERILAALAEMNQTLRAIQRDIADVAELARDLKAQRDTYMQVMANAAEIRGR